LWSVTGAIGTASVNYAMGRSGCTMAKAKTLQKAKEKRYIKKGLVHSPMKIEVQEVTSRMTKPCAGCEQRIEDRRLVVRTGGAKHGKTEFYCDTCGEEWLNNHLRIVKATIPYLKNQTDKAIRDI